MNSNENSLFKKEPAINPNAEIVLRERYLKKDGNGKVIETPKELFIRVAKNISEAEKKFNPKADCNKYAGLFYDEMVSMNFLPNSPTLMNAGKDLQQLAACFVLPVDDSLEAIFDAVKYTALIHKSGGGTGFSFSRLRPKDDSVRTTKGVSSGPVSFMSVFDSATETIKQGGTRRGANMGILRVDHPDIMEFIHAKKDKTKLTNFNTSVGITEDFMKAVKNNSEYNLINPKTGKIHSTLNAKNVFDEMVQLAWEGGDPGIVFLDRINRENPTPAEGDMESTNPCGEQPLLPYESCNLGSINVANFINKNRDGVDWKRLKHTIHTAVRFLDNVIEMNSYPIPQIEVMTKKNRKIGLGLMGWADLLAMLEIPYNSDKAIQLAEELMKFIRDEGRTCSSELAVERGNFPGFEKSIYPAMGFKNMRNATVTTIAPTGTISIIASASSGIEPFFALAFYRNVMDNKKLPEVNPVFINVAKKDGFYSESLMEQIADSGTLHDVDNVPEKWKKVFVTSHDISPISHVKMQAAFQKYTDNAVSKTVNFENSATIEDVRNVYTLAYELFCKGITIYRDGSRMGQVINVGKDKESKETVILDVPLTKYTPRPRPDLLIGKTVEVTTGCGKMYVTINQDMQGDMFEIFTHIGKAGGCAQAQSEAIGRLVSLALRSGSEPEAIIKQLKGISCHMKYGMGGQSVLSCGDAVAQALEKALNSPLNVTVTATIQPSVEDFLKESENKTANKKRRISNGACPECGGQIENVEGCNVCYSCGYSHCS